MLYYPFFWTILILNVAFANIVKQLPEVFFKYIDFILADNDGINKYINRSNWPYDRESLREFYMTLGIKKNKIYDIGDETMGVWESS